MTDTELIEAVAVEVMGWHKVRVMGDNFWIPKNHIRPHSEDLFLTVNCDKKTDFNPLTDMNHMMMVVEKMKSLYPEMLIQRVRETYGATFLKSENKFTRTHSSIGHAVCLAALEAVRGEKSELL